MYFKRIESNIKKVAEYELTPCTVVVGKSGQGKSAIVDSYSLVLSGEAKTPGLGKKVGHLNATLPEGEEALRVVGVLDDDSAVEVTQQGAALGYRCTLQSDLRLVGHDYAAAVESLLLGQSSRLAKTIIEASGHKIAWHRIASELPERLSGLLLDMFHAADVSVKTDSNGLPVGSQEFPAAQVTKALESAKSKLRNVTKDTKDAQRVTANSPEEPSAAELKELKELEALQLSLMHLPTDTARAQAELQSTISQIASYRESLDALPEYSDTDIEEARHNSGLLIMLRETIDEVLAVAALQAVHCPLCGKATDVAELQQRHKQIVATHSELVEWLSTAVSVQDSRQRFTANINRLDKRESQLTELLTQGTVSQRVDHNRIAEIKEKVATWEVAKSALSRLPRLEKQCEDLEQIKKALQGQLDQAVVDAVSTIERRVNKFLPTKYRAKIATDGQSIGMSLDGTSGPFHDYRALSKAQRTLLGVALAAATIPEDAPPVRALVIDEVPMDTATAKVMLKAIASHIAQPGGFSQALVSLVSLTGKEPEGWTKISVDPVKKRGKRTEEKEQTDE